MRFSSIGSGSSGNALLIEHRNTRVILDCGLGLAVFEERVRQRGWEPDSIDAILVTHEHSDHIGGVERVARKYGIPVMASYGTLSFLGDSERVTTREIWGDSAIALGDLEISPFSVPHDAREPLQFVIGNGDVRLGVLTDVGRSTPHIEEMLSGADALVLECNHDLKLLMAGPYPYSLKERVKGPYGHLDNEAAATLLSKLDRTRLKHVIAAHLSLQNNEPHLAKNALAHVLGCEAEWVGVATQDEGFEWREL
jgi:phosphoribosyl 1,2-cyclic phosphodiesterase